VYASARKDNLELRSYLRPRKRPQIPPAADSERVALEPEKLLSARIQLVVMFHARVHDKRDDDSWPG
jgi:hypothetical protein